MAVNRPSPRVQPEDKIGLRRHKSMATGLQVLCMLHSVAHAKPSIAAVAVLLASKQTKHLENGMLFL